MNFLDTPGSSSPLLVSLSKSSSTPVEVGMGELWLLAALRLRSWQGRAEPLHSKASLVSSSATGERRGGGDRGGGPAVVERGSFLSVYTLWGVVVNVQNNHPTGRV